MGNDTNAVGEYWVGRLNECVDILKQVQSYPIDGPLAVEAMKNMVGNFLKSNGYIAPSAPAEGDGK